MILETFVIPYLDYFLNNNVRPSKFDQFLKTSSTQENECEALQTHQKQYQDIL